MGFFRYMVGAVATLGLLFPAEAVTSAAAGAAREETENSQTAICRDFLQTTANLWFLLSGIRNREDADRSADYFLELVHRVCVLDEQLGSASTSSGLPLEVEEVVRGRRSEDSAAELESLQVRILESFEDLNAEFLGLCRVHCYGSEKLAHAFVAAGESGMFAEESLALLAEPTTPLSEAETQEEMLRLKRLVEPDRALLQVLQQVKDAASAGRAVEPLAALTKRLRGLLPPIPVAHRRISPRELPRMRAATAPIEPLLWGIRTELVRIAALPGYDAAAYDPFSEALNAMYESLGESHSGLFDDVFDASFRADLDEALQENAPEP